MAAGGNLVIRANTIRSPSTRRRPRSRPTATAATPTFFVGGGVVWENPNSEVKVENQGFTKIADTSTYTVHVKDSNGATQPYRIVKKDAKYESQPRIEGRSRDQSVESVGTPVPRSVIDIPEAFIAYRNSSASLSGCAETVTLRNANGDTLPRPVTGGQAYVSLEPNTTNVLNLTVGEAGRHVGAVVPYETDRVLATADQRHRWIVHRPDSQPAWDRRSRRAVHPVELPRRDRRADQQRGHPRGDPVRSERRRVLAGEPEHRGQRDRPAVHPRGRRFGGTRLRLQRRAAVQRRAQRSRPPSTEPTDEPTDEPSETEPPSETPTEPEPTEESPTATDTPDETPTDTGADGRGVSLRDSAHRPAHRPAHRRAHRRAHRPTHG